MLHFKVIVNLSCVIAASQVAQSESVLIQHDVISGYSFDESDSSSKRLGPGLLAHSDLIPMSLHQCRKACLLEEDCHSYSVCTIGEETECIVSTVDLTSHDTSMVEQLQADNTKMVTSEGVSFGVQKRSECEIHVKHYAPMFDNPEKVDMRLGYFGSFDIIPVDYLDLCAERCVYETLNSSSMNFDRASTIRDVSPGPKQVSNKHACTHFFYVEHNTLMELDESAREAFLKLIDEGSNRKISSVYCLFKSRSKGASDDYSSLGATQIAAERRDVKSRNFYEEHEGVRLKSSPISKEEKAAWHRIYETSEPDESDLNLVRPFIERGDNWQTSSMPLRCMLQASGEECARLCFLQQQLGAPMCKSYDVLIQKRGNYEVMTCSLNSISMNEVVEKNRTDLIEHVSDEVQTWHYEPITAFTINVINNK